MARGRDVVVNIVGRFRGRNEFKQAQNELGKMGVVGQKATGVLNRFGLAGIGAGTAASGLAAGLGAAALAAQKAVASFVDLAGKIRDVQRASGATAEEASLLVAVGDDFEISAEQMAKAMGFLARNIDDADKKLTPFGVAVAKNADGSTDLVGTLLNLSDAYAGTADPARRAELASGVLGRGYQTLIPILEKGRKGLSAFFESAEGDNQVFTQEQLDKAEQYRLTLDSLQDALGGLSRATGETLLPALEKVANALTTVLHAADSLGDAFGRLPEPVQNAAKTMAGEFVQSLNPLFRLVALLDRSVDGFIDGPIKGLENLEGAGGGVEELVESTLTLVEAQEKSADAADTLFDAQEKLADLQTITADEAKEIADAEEKVSESRLRAVEATEEVAEAERDLNELRLSESERAARAVERAELDKLSAQDRAADLAATIAEKEAELARRRAAGASPRVIAEGEEELSDLKRDQRGATLDLADSEDSLAAARQAQIAGTDELKSAQERYESATKNAASATDSLRDAEQKVIDLTEDAVGSARDIAKAKRDVAAANREIAASIDAVRLASDAEHQAAQVRAESQPSASGASRFAGAKTTVTGATVSYAGANITVVAQDPNEMERKLAAKSRTARLVEGAWG